jgi:hypothetical protein
MSGIGILQVKGVYAHYHYKPRNPDERSWVTVTWTRAQPGGLKHIANREIATPVDINIMSSKVPNSRRVKSRWDLNRWIKH